MKKIWIILLLAVSVPGVLSCSLEEDRESFADRKHSFNTVYQAEAVVKSCYGSVKSIFSSSFAMMNECATDLWYDNTSIVDAVCTYSPVRPGMGKNIWVYCYQGIMRANECIECLEHASFDEARRKALQAECRVLRALFYYYLTNTYDGVPFYTFMVKDDAALRRVRKLPRTPGNDIRRALYDDLKENALPYFTEELGLRVRTIDIKGNRAGYPLALMLMGKFAMWYEDWDAALDALKELELLYGEFSEANYPLDDTVWWKKNTAESIFEVQHAWSADGIQFSGSACTLFYPSVHSDTSPDGVFMPEWGMQLSSHSVVRASYKFAVFRPDTGENKSENSSYTSAIFYPLPLTYGQYNPDIKRYEAVLDMNAIMRGTIRGQKIDRRIYYVLGLGNLETGETFGEVKKYGRPYAGRKFWIPGRVGNADSNNYKIFRYADAIQMMAECWCRKGEFEKALQYLNLPRIRAGVDAYSGIDDEEQIMKLIQDERARELCGEMHRRYDLVRWDIWYDRIIACQPSGAKIRQSIQPYQKYYPIPDSECALTGYVLTNPDYPGGSVEDGDYEEGEEDDDF